MKEILIVSGKGGTGKTSISACFAQLSKDAVFCDCDVDAANLHLLLAPEIRETQEFFAGWMPQMDKTRCIACGKCQQLCRFNAIELQDGVPKLLTSSCEGCGVCADNCPAAAITLAPRRCGTLYTSATKYGMMFHAELLPGEENSGKLIAQLRKSAGKAAQESGAKLLISDGPPGIGCPVISAMSGVDLVVAVTEPTPSGVHDLKRLMLLAKQFGIPAMVIINKWDLNEQLSKEISGFCNENGFPELGRIPFDPIFAQRLKAGETVLTPPENIPAIKIKEIWQKLDNSIN